MKLVNNNTMVYGTQHQYHQNNETGGKLLDEVNKCHLEEELDFEPEDGEVFPDAPTNFIEPREDEDCNDQTASFLEPIEDEDNDVKYIPLILDYCPTNTILIDSSESESCNEEEEEIHDCTMGEADSGTASTTSSQLRKNEILRTFNNTPVDHAPSPTFYDELPPVIATCSTTFKVTFNGMAAPPQKRRAWTQKMPPDELVPKICSQNSLFTDWSMKPSQTATTPLPPPIRSPPPAPPTHSPPIFKMPIKRPPTLTKTKVQLKKTPLASPMVSDKDDCLSLFGGSFCSVVSGELLGAESISSASLPEFEPPLRAEPLVAIAKPNVSEWLASIECSTNNCKGINWEAAPKLYRGICRFSMRGIRCGRRVCIYAHQIATNRIEALPVTELLRTFDWTKSLPPLYEQTFKAFALAFGRKDLKTNLVTMLSDSITISPNKFKENLQSVIEGLKVSGLKIEESVEFVLIQFGVSKYPQLADLLLEIIADQFRNEDNYDLLTKLSLGRQKPFDSRTMSKIVEKCVRAFPINVNLCANLQHLVSKNLIGETDIPNVLRSAFRKSCQLQDKTKHLESSFGTSIQNCRSPDFGERLARLLMREKTNHAPAPPTTPSPIPSTFEEDMAQIYAPIIQPPRPQTLTIIPPPPPPPPAIAFPFPPPPLFCSQPPPVICPTTPIFGQPDYPPNFYLDKSLHCFYPVAPPIDAPLHDSDIIALNDAIRSANGARFLDIIHTHQSNVAIYGLICATLAELMSQHGRLFSDYNRLLNSMVQVQPLNRLDKTTRAVLEVVSFNLLFSKDCPSDLSGIWQVLERFHNWDTLLSSKFLKKTSMTMMTRYLYLARILVNINKFFLAFELIRHPDLKLFMDACHWPYSRSKHDLNLRNSLITKLVMESCVHHFAVVHELFLLDERDRSGGRVGGLLEGVVNKLLAGDHETSLKVVARNLSLYAKYLSKDRLRAVFLSVERRLERAELQDVFDVCVSRGVYTKYVGGEREIIIFTDFTNYEIAALVKSFVDALKRFNYAKFDIKIELVRPAVSYNRDWMLQQPRLLYELRECIKKIFLSDFGVTLTDTHSTYVLLLSADEANRLLYSSVK